MFRHNSPKHNSYLVSLDYLGLYFTSFLTIGFIVDFLSTSKKNMIALSVKGFLTGSIIYHRLQNRRALKYRLKAHKIVRFFDPSSTDRTYSFLHCGETRIANICKQISCKRITNIILYKHYIHITFLYNNSLFLRCHAFVLSINYMTDLHHQFNFQTENKIFDKKSTCSDS